MWVGQPGAHMLCCSLGFVRMSSGEGGWECVVSILHTGQSTWIEFVHTLSRCRENVNNGFHWFLGSQRVFSDPGELSQFPSTLYVGYLSHLLRRRCLLALSYLLEEIALSVCVYSMCSWEGLSPPAVPTSLWLFIHYFCWLGGDMHWNFLFRHLADDLLL